MSLRRRIASRLRGGLAVALAVVVGALAPARCVGADRADAARTIDGIAMTVSDVTRSVAFFTDVLGFEHLGDADASGPAYESLWSVPGVRARLARLRLGREHLELIEFTAPADGRSIPDDSRSNDAWFQHLAIVVRDMEPAHARVVASGVRAVSSGPQVLPRSNAAAAGIAAFYFTDPDGHVLELIHYPPGKGDPRWQRAAGRLFLGIDHTAIAVTDTDASVAFYRDRLGLVVVGESLNEGIEQERLTGVTGARVRITGLRAPGGPPGIELLEYRAPRDGRRLATVPRVQDVVHWHPTVVVGALAATAGGHSVIFDAAGSAVASPPALGFARAVLVRDPDGHAVQLVAPVAAPAAAARREVSSAAP
jgi:catechol 2,3-dioxygenase-like lactoylglutathione lyase family enzyme